MLVYLFSLCSFFFASLQKYGSFLRSLTLSISLLPCLVDFLGSLVYTFYALAIPVFPPNTDWGVISVSLSPRMLVDRLCYFYSPSCLTWHLEGRILLDWPFYTLSAVQTEYSSPVCTGYSDLTECKPFSSLMCPIPIGRGPHWRMGPSAVDVLLKLFCFGRIAKKSTKHKVNFVIF